MRLRCESPFVLNEARFGAEHDRTGGSRSEGGRAPGRGSLSGAVQLAAA